MTIKCSIKLVKVYVLLVVCGMLYSCASQNPGLKAYMRGQLDDTIIYYSDILKTDPRNIEARLYRAISYKFKGRYDEAIADFDELIVLDPKNEYVHRTNRAGAYLMKGEYNRAIEDCDWVIASNPSVSNPLAFGAYGNKAQALAKAGRMNDALVIYDKLIENSPSKSNTTSVYMSRGMLYTNMKQFDKAIDDFTKALDLCGRCEGIYNLRGGAYHGSGNWDRAIADFDQAIRIKPDYFFPYFEKAVILDSAGRHAEALSAYQKFLSLPERSLLETGIINFIIDHTLGLENKKDIFLPENLQKHAAKRVRELSGSSTQ